jgi:nitrite reductase/ring-hydroxylating ferredoxin subunit
MSEKKYTWYKIASSVHELQWQENEIAITEVNGRKICLAKYQHKIFAFQNKCPHSGGLFDAGYLDMLGNVVCPVHHYKFNIKNGFNSTGEGFVLKTFPVDEKTDGVYIGMEDGILFQNL